MRLPLVPFLLAAALAVPAPTARAESPSQPMAVMTKAQPQGSFPMPGYPSAMVEREQEGWVRLSYTVAEDGGITDIRVLESSDKFGRFERNAAEALARWAHAPATIAGKPVAQRNNEATVSFVLRPGATPSPKVVAAFGRVDDALKAGRPDEAMGILDGLEDGERGLTIQELAHLFARRSFAYRLMRQEGRALVFARKALVGGEDALGSKLHGALLLVRLEMELRAGAFAAAFDTAGKLEQARRRPDGDAEVMAMLARARDLAASAKPILVRMTLEQDCFGDCGPDGAVWRHDPLRQTVVFQAIQGRLDSVTAQCERKETTGTAKPGEFWSIPASWGDCTLQLAGARGTVVEIVEE